MRTSRVARSWNGSTVTSYYYYPWPEGAWHVRRPHDGCSAPSRRAVYAWDTDGSLHLWGNRRPSPLARAITDPRGCCTTVGAPPASRYDEAARNALFCSHVCRACLPSLIAPLQIPVLDSLGSPIIRSPMWTGSAGRESVAAAVPLFGPRGRGTLHARAFYVPEVASKETTDAPNARKDPIGEGTNLIQFGSWHPVILLLELPSGQVIDLLDDGKTVEAGAGPWATDATGPHHMAPSDTDSPPNT